MAYTYKGMRKMSWPEVINRYNNTSLVGCYKLYNDGTESVMDYLLSWEDILIHHNNGGEFGEEITDYNDSMMSFFSENIKEINSVFGTEIPSFQPGDEYARLIYCACQYLFYVYSNKNDLEDSFSPEAFDEIKDWDTYAYIDNKHVVFQAVNYSWKKHIVIGDFDEDEEKILKELHDKEFGLKTNFQMLTDLLKKYTPKRRGIASNEEVNLITEKLRLNKMNVLQLRNLRDFVVLYLSSQSSDDKEICDTNMDRMSAITAVIDSYIFNKGAEV